MTSNHRIIRTALAAAIVTFSVSITPAQAQLNVHIDIAPPAPQYEIVPSVRSGYTWAPGYWAWQGQDYRWVGGRQIAQRPGYRWVADHWEQGNRYRAGYWAPLSRREHYQDERDDDRNDKHRGAGHKDRGNFCPPGQAKKGNC